MKTKFIIFVFAASMNTILLADPPPFRVTKERIQTKQVEGEMMKPDAEFRIQPTNDNADIPELAIPTYSTGRRRIVDVRHSQGRMEVAIQVDELGIDYYDYRLNDGHWTLEKQRRICSLNGMLALKLAQVDIVEDGLVQVTYRDESSDGRASSWADELLTKENRGKAGLMKEEYKLKDGQFTLSGDPVRLRPAVAANTQKSEEQNEAQHPTDEAAEPEKPKE
jgi:hypothetical protein